MKQKTSKHDATPWLPFAVAMAAGILWLIWHAGFAPMSPLNVAWLRNNDWAQHYLGWAFFRRSSISWPLGHVDGLGSPTGTQLSLVDANPPMALLLRPLSPYLPQHFQYIGPFMGVCFMAQAFMGVALLRLYSRDAISQCLAGIFYALAPILINRVGHDTLTTHALILWALYLALRPASTAGAAHIVSATLCLCLATALHPYMALMVAPLLSVAAIEARINGSMSLSKILLAALTASALALAISVCLGTLASDVEQKANGFGYFASDLLAFVNPMGTSRIFKSIPTLGGRYEGYAYLGAGGLGLVMLSSLLFVARWRVVHKGRLSARRPLWLMLASVAALCLLLALSSVVCAGRHIILNGEAQVLRVLPILAAVRASGRFVWVPYYLVMTASLAVLARSMGHKKLRLALAVLVALQLFDSDHKNTKALFAKKHVEPLTSKAWSMMTGDYDTLVLYPPYFDVAHKTCQKAKMPAGFQWPYTFLAYEQGLSINSLYASRYMVEPTIRYCRKIHQDITHGILDDTSVYVVDPRFDAVFKKMVAQAVCAPVDARMMCVARRRPTKLSAFLMAHR